MDETAIKKRGRPKGSKNKTTKVKAKVRSRVRSGTKTEVSEFPAYRYDPDADYRFWFIADACGCRIGSNIMGAGMWCKHKNTMHIEERMK